MSTLDLVKSYDELPSAKSLYAMHSLTIEMHKPLHRLSLHSPFAARIITPFAVIPLSIARLVPAIISIAENIIVGLVKTLGSLLSNDFSFTDGITHLIRFPLNTILSTAVTLPLGLITGLIHPIINPEKYCDIIIKASTDELDKK